LTELLRRAVTELTELPKLDRRNVKDRRGNFLDGINKISRIGRQADS
jgi:hypothetical protein